MDTKTRFFPLRYAVSHGALPALVLGMLADFGTPVGLHWFSWFLAALYLLALALFITRPGARQTAYDLLCAPEEARRTPFLVNPFAWALIVGASIAGLGGVLSYLSREEGGFLASNVQMLREVQTTNLLLTRSIEVQEEISGKLDDVKRETSDNPAKELANMGFDMSPSGIQSAMSLGNVQAVQLFADAGSTVSADSFSVLHPSIRELSPVWKVVSTGNLAMAEALARLGTAKDPALCLAPPGFGRGAAAILVTAEQQRAFRTLCAGDLAEKQLRENWEERKLSHSENTPVNLSAFKETCAREANEFLTQLDMVKDAEMLLELQTKLRMKEAGVDAEPVQLKEVAADYAFQEGTKQSRMNDRFIVEMHLSRESIPSVAGDACEKMASLVSASKLGKNDDATTDEDFKAMLAALED